MLQKSIFRNVSAAGLSGDPLTALSRLRALARYFVAYWNRRAQFAMLSQRFRVTRGVSNTTDQRTRARGQRGRGRGLAAELQTSPRPSEKSDDRRLLA